MSLEKNLPCTRSDLSTKAAFGLLSIGFAVVWRPAGEFRTCTHTCTYV